MARCSWRVASKAFGMGAASFASGAGFGYGKRDWGTDFFERGENKSEQRYSGKPDGEAGTPKESVELRV